MPKRAHKERSPQAFPGQWRGGRGRTRWSYGYQEIADLFGVKVNTVRQWASSGKIVPSSLRSVVAYRLQTDAKRRQVRG